MYVDQPLVPTGAVWRLKEACSSSIMWTSPSVRELLPSCFQVLSRLEGIEKAERNVR